MLQLVGTGRQFLLGHADFLAERFGVGLGGLHTLGQIADLLLAGGLFLRQLVEFAVLIVDEERRRAGVGDGQDDEDPFAGVAMRLGMIRGGLFAFGHKGWVSG